MAEINITQTEALALIGMPKQRTDDDLHPFPDFGGSISLPLTSLDKREGFLLDISRGRIYLQKVKFQNRGRHVIVLVRLDLSGPPHHNPDGVEVPCPHLHVYREGYADKFAQPLPAAQFADTADLMRTLDDFMRFCNIIAPPCIKRGLFT